MENFSEKKNYIFQNIDWTKSLVQSDQNISKVGLVSGSEEEQLFWQDVFDRSKTNLFNHSKDTTILSLQEKINDKTRQGNFLGTLLAYQNFKCWAEKNGQGFWNDQVTLLGMLFGRGERVSPFTQILGNCKPSIEVISGISKKFQRSAIEDALYFAAPIGQFLQRHGFQGILCKWGDETQIPSIDLSKFMSENYFEEYDIVKFISVLKVTDDLAKQKDWVVFGEKNQNMLAQISRSPKKTLIEKLKEYGIKSQPDGSFYSGVSLGTVAISYKLLEIAEEVFSSEILKNGVYFDFDPYFLMALTLPDDQSLWEHQRDLDPGIDSLEQMIPQFFQKVQTIKTLFRERYQRDLGVKVFDLGDEVFWKDIGQHTAMYDKFMGLNENSFSGDISRKIEGLDLEKDPDGNRVLNSYISPDVKVKNSVVLNSIVLGSGEINGSVIKNSLLKDMNACDAFSVSSIRKNVMLKKRSGLYESIGLEALLLNEGERSGTLLFSEDEKIDLKVHEETDLKKRDENYDAKIFDNKISFSEAYDRMKKLNKINVRQWRQKQIQMISKKLLSDLQKKDIPRSLIESFEMFGN